MTRRLHQKAIIVTVLSAVAGWTFGQPKQPVALDVKASGGKTFYVVLSIDIAEQEVQAAINAAGNLLPADLPAAPIYAKVNPADAPVLTLGITSSTLPLTQVESMAETLLAQKISQVAGVGLVTVSGGQRPAVRIRANARALAAYGLNLDDLRTTIANINVNTSKGWFDRPTQSCTINANDQLQSAAQYKDAVIAYKSGSPVRLSDVATVIEAAENTKLGAWMNNTPEIIDVVRHRIQHHRADWRHPADRHCQEERDHDDRLRVAGVARGQEFARRNLSGLLTALSADHDDHECRAAGRVAAGVRQR